MPSIVSKKSEKNASFQQSDTDAEHMDILQQIDSCRYLAHCILIKVIKEKAKKVLRMFFCTDF